MTLRRTGSLPRYAPLRSSKPLVSHSDLPRSGPIRRVRTHEEVRAARRPLVTPEERRARKLVRKRSGGICERCGRAQATNWHHRVAKGRGGAWCSSNGLDLCGSGSTGCHGEVTASPALAYERGWSVRTQHDPARVPVWLAGRGWSYLTSTGEIVPAERSAA